MRLVIGNPPAAKQLAQPLDGWQKLPAPSAKAIQAYGLIVSCLGILLIAVILNWAIQPSSGWMALLLLVTILPLHELVHALTTPSWGLSNRTIIGLQWSKGLLLPYMYFDGIQPLWRMLLTGLSPVAMLTILPVIVLCVMPLSAAARADLGFLAFFNAGISGGNVVMFFWLITHLPLAAAVKGDGWGIQWREQAE